MERVSELAKVGLAVVVAAVLFVSAMIVIKGDYVRLHDTYPVTVHFDDAMGLERNMDLKMAGISVGFVHGDPYFEPAIGKTVATIRIKRPYRVYTDSRFIIYREGLLGDRYLAVENPPLQKPEDIEDWSPPEPLEESQLVGENAVALLGTADPDVTQVISSASRVLDTVEVLLDEEHLGGALTSLADNVNSSMERVNSILDQLSMFFDDERGYVTSSVENIHEMSANFLAMSENLQAASDELSALATDPIYGERMETLTANMERASTSLASLAEQLDQLVSDPQLQQDAKDSVRLTKETLEETKATIQRFQETLDNVDVVLDSADDLMEGAGDTLEETRSTISRYNDIGDAVDVRLGFNVRAVDVDKDHGPSSDDIYVGDANLAVGYNDAYVQIGAENIGEQNDFNFMLGWGDLNAFSLRGGVYRSELGIGASYYFGAGGLEAMLYDTEDPKLNVLGRVSAGDAIDVLVGVEDIENDPIYTAGLGVSL